MLAKPCTSAVLTVVSHFAVNTNAGTVAIAALATLLAMLAYASASALYTNVAYLFVWADTSAVAIQAPVPLNLVNAEACAAALQTQITNLLVRADTSTTALDATCFALAVLTLLVHVLLNARHLADPNWVVESS
jgi:hypothetical protein